jgi:(p)ppGpp synthase/HD superfamily hydrolase
MRRQSQAAGTASLCVLFSLTFTNRRGTKDAMKDQQDRDIIQAAIELAYLAHKGQNRKFGHSFDPYIMHPMRVAGLIQIAVPQRVFPVGVAAAWLHDAVEEGMPMGQLIKAFSMFRPEGDQIIEVVAALTKPDIQGSRQERVQAMIEQVQRGPYLAKLIKLADRADNLDDLATDELAPEPFARKYAGEARQLLEALKGTSVFLEARLTILIAVIEQRVWKK